MIEKNYNLILHNFYTRKMKRKNNYPQVINKMWIKYYLIQYVDMYVENFF